MAPAAIPSIARDTARNDRWYQVRTERSRPSRISRRSVANVAQNRPAKSIAPFYARSRCAHRSGIDAKPRTVRRNALIAEPRHAFMHEIDCKYAMSTGRWGLDTQSDSGVLA